jgi:hypothetical protein
MKLLLRAGFLLLMLLAIQQRIIWFKLGEASQNPLASTARNLDALSLHSAGPDGNGLIQATAPGCPISFPVGMFALDGGEDARIAALLPPHSLKLYIYLGKTAPTRPQLHPITAWLAANVAAMAGARNTQPPTKLVLAALPVQCPQLATLNWASISQ